MSTPPDRAELPTGTSPASYERPSGSESADSGLRHFNLLLRHLRLIIALPLAGAIAGGAAALVLPSKYSVEVRFAPNISEADPTRLAGLAAQFGVSIGGYSGSESLEFYAALVKSRGVLQNAATTYYAFPTERDGLDTLNGTLIQLYDVEADSPEQTLAAAVTLLEDAVTVRTSLEASLVTIETTARWSVLAEQLAAGLLDLVNEFNLEKRQSTARAEREFVEQRLEEARAELDAAEIELQEFVDRNRTYRPASPTGLQVARLQRRVDLRQQVYTTLAQAYEQARIEQVRNTPVITVVDAPEGAAKREGRLMINVLVGGFLGAFIAFCVIFLAQYLQHEEDAHPAVYAEFKQLSRSTVATFVRSLRIDRLPRNLIGRLTGRRHIKGQNAESP